MRPPINMSSHGVTPGALGPSFQSCARQPVRCQPLSLAVAIGAPSRRTSCCPLAPRKTDTRWYRPEPTALERGAGDLESANMTTCNNMLVWASKLAVAFSISYSSIVTSLTSSVGSPKITSTCEEKVQAGRWEIGATSSSLLADLRLVGGSSGAAQFNVQADSALTLHHVQMDGGVITSAGLCLSWIRS